MSKSVQGSLRPKSAKTRFDRALWCRFISGRPEFRRRSPAEKVNPFTGAKLVIPAPADSAEVVVDNRVIGSVWWSMSDKPLVNVSIEPSAMPLVSEWAAILNAEFHAEDWGE